MSSKLLSIKLAVCFLLIVCVSRSQDIPSYIPKNGLLAWYPFNGNANDESGNNNHGKIYGAELTSDRLGNNNKAFAFNGNSSYISCPPIGKIDDSRELTISVWVKLNDTSTSPWFIISRGGDRAEGHFKLLYFDRMFGASLNSPWIDQDASVTTIKKYESFQSEWHHILVVYNSSSVKLYIDNNLANSSSFSKSIGNLSSPILIGKSEMSCCPYYFNGQIDDIGIWNRAINENEIEALFKANNSKVKVENVTDIDNQQIISFNKVNSPVDSSKNIITWEGVNNQGLKTLFTKQNNGDWIESNTNGNYYYSEIDSKENQFTLWDKNRDGIFIMLKSNACFYRDKTTGWAQIFMGAFNNSISKPKRDTPESFRLKVGSIGLNLKPLWDNTGKWYYYDSDKKDYTPVIGMFDYAWDFIGNMGPVVVNGKRGFIDKEGKFIIPCKYEDIETHINEGVIIAQFGGKYGLINLKDSVVTPFIYDYAGVWAVWPPDLDKLGYKRYCIVVKRDGKYGFLDFAGRTLIPCKYDKVGELSYGMYGVELNGKNGVVNERGFEVIPTIYDEISEFEYESLSMSSSSVFATIRKNNKYGYINLDCKTIIPCKYDSIISPFDYTRNTAVVRLGNILYTFDKIGKIVSTKDLTPEILARKKAQAEQERRWQQQRKQEELERQREANAIHSCRWCGRKFKGEGFSPGINDPGFNIFRGAFGVSSYYCSKKCWYEDH